MWMELEQNRRQENAKFYLFNVEKNLFAKERFTCRSACLTELFLCLEWDFENETVSIEITSIAFPVSIQYK